MLRRLLRDEVYISIRVVSDQDLERASIDEMVELLVVFFRLVVGMLLVASAAARAVSEMVGAMGEAIRRTGRELGKAEQTFEDRLYLEWEMGVILARAMAYGAGLME